MATTTFLPHTSLQSNLSININSKLGLSKAKKQSKRAVGKSFLNSEINFLEDRITAIFKANASIAVKSTQSAVYLLVKNLLKEGDNIVTLNSIGLYKNEVIRERLGIEVRLADDEDISSFKNLINANTKLIYLESLGIKNHIIPDFQKIISHAKTKNIPVVVDNTVGIVGNIVNPIALGANFLIEDLSTLTGETIKPYGAVLVDSQSYNWEKGIFYQYKDKKSTFSLINFIKDSINKLTPLKGAANIFNLIEKLEVSPARVQKLSKTSLFISKWLKENTYIKEVEYAGFATHPSHINALKYYNGGFGNIISISLWANYRSFDFFLDNLLPRSFNLFKILDINYESKQITIKLLDTNFEKQVQHFQHSFDLLQKYLGSDYFLYENLYDVQDLVGY